MKQYLQLIFLFLFPFVTSIDFSSPNTRFKKDLDVVSKGLAELQGMGQNFGSAIEHQNNCVELTEGSN